MRVPAWHLSCLPIGTPHIQGTAVPALASASVWNPSVFGHAGRGLRYAERSSCDVDEHATHISGWDQEYDQLSCGRFTGAVRELWVEGGPRLQIFHEHTGQQTSQQCRPWPGSVWFGVPDGQSNDALHFSGRLQPSDRMRLLMSARADDGFALRTPRDFGIYGVVVDQAWLGDRLTRQGTSDVQVAELAPHAHVAICQTVEALFGLGASGTTLGHANADTVQCLLERLLGLLSGATPGSARDAQFQAGQRRLDAVMAARSLAVQPLNHAMTLDELCLHLHVTPRTLRNHFRSVVGESPVEFLRAVRLNACRRKLSGTQRDGTVQEVAAQWGFFHMGRFSHDYKAMFGELPSQTLRHSRASH